MKERPSLFKKSSDPGLEICPICKSILVFVPEKNWMYCYKCNMGISDPNSNKLINNTRVEIDRTLENERPSLFKKSVQEEKPQTSMGVNLVKKTDDDYVELLTVGTMEQPGLRFITSALRGAVRNFEFGTFKERWFYFKINGFTSRLEQYRSPHDKLDWERKYVRKKDFDKLLGYIKKVLKLKVPLSDRDVLEKGILSQFRSQELFKKPALILKDYEREKETKYDALNKILTLIENSEDDSVAINSVDSLLKLYSEPKIDNLTDLDERVFEIFENLVISHESELVKCAAVRSLFYLFPKRSLEPLMFLIVKYEPKSSSNLSDVIEIFSRFIDILKQPLSNPSSGFYYYANELLKALLYRINLFPKTSQYRNCVEYIVSRDQQSKPYIIKKEDVDSYFSSNVFNMNIKVQTVLGPTQVPPVISDSFAEKRGKIQISLHPEDFKKQMSNNLLFKNKENVKVSGFNKEVINEIIEKYKKCGNWDIVACDYGVDCLSVISSVVDSIGSRQYHELVRTYSQNPIEREEIDVPSEDEFFGGSFSGLHKTTFLHGQSSSDVVRPTETSVFAIDKKTEIPQTQRIRIPYSKTLSDNCQLAKKLRSRAVFLGRQLYFLRTNKKNYNLAKQYPEDAKKILEFMERKLDSPQLYEEFKQKLYVNPSLQISGALFKKLKTFENSIYLNEFLKFEKSFVNLGKIYSQLPAQVLRNVASEWKGYNESHDSWQINPSSFDGEPRIPSKNRKTNEYLLTIPGAFVNNKKYASSIVDRFISTSRPTRNSKRLRSQLSKYCSSGELTLPQKFLDIFPSSDPFPIVRTTIDIGSIIEVKIVPKKVFFEVQVVYTVKKFENSLLDPKKAYSIDIGVNNSIGLTNNFGEQPILVRGRLIKSVNQWMNKRIGTLRSVQTQGITFKKGDLFPETLEMARIRRKRDAIIDDYFHKVSRFVINRCLKNRAKYLAIGYNAGWKKDLTSTENKKMRHEDRQTFAHIPFLKLIEMIKYKADLVGITVVRIGESHTSMCSAVDFEPIEHRETYFGQRGVSLKGKNKKKKIEAGEPEDKYYKARGLFRTKDGLIIHSDINAAYNIGRRAFPELFNEYTLDVRKMLKPPRVVYVYKHVKSVKKNRYIKQSCAMV